MRAIAAAEGVKADVPEHDSDSCDIEFAGPDTPSGPGGRLTAQLKCSENIDLAGPTFPFDLKVKNYNDLRWPKEQLYVPRILVVVHVPPEPSEWIKCDPGQMVLRRCAYWMSLAGSPEVDNRATIRVHVPTNQVFDGAALMANLGTPGENL